MNTLLQDARHALRVMRRNKTFAAATLFTLALGIGANTAVFSVVYGVLLRPLPYPEADRLVRISEEHPSGRSPLRESYVSNLTYFAWTEGPHTLEGIAAYSSRNYTVSGFDEPARVQGAAVSPLLFPMLRATPAAGRFFRPEEAADGAAPVVVLSHRMWRERFGAAPDAVGRTLVVDERAHTIVGVAAPAFYFPDSDARLWTPYAPRPRLSPTDGAVGVFFAIGRLRPGVTIAQAEAEGTAAARSIGKRPIAADMLFGSGGPVVVHVRTLVDQTTGSVKPALAVLAVGVGLVLLIACANVANLFLSRGLARRRELAVRAALGAGRGRLVRQLLVEGFTLSLGGGLLGLALAWGLTRALPALAPADFPRLDDVRIDGRVLAFAALASILAGLLSGLAPALRSARFNLAASLHGTWSSSGGFRGPWAARLRGALLVTEAALAVMLLIGAGLLVRSFVRLVRVDAGYDAANVLTARIYLPTTDASPARNGQFIDALLERVRGVPGVVAAGVGNMAPFGDSTYISAFRLPSREADDQTPMVRALEYVVTPGYAEALGLRLREGRLFTDQDAGAGGQAMIVNRDFVRQYMTNRPVIGLRLPGARTEPDQFSDIIGIIDNVLKNGLDSQPQPEIYLVRRANKTLGHIHLMVRTTGDPVVLAPVLRGYVHELDRNAVVDDVATLARRVSGSVSQPRFAAAVLAAFAAVALALAAIGLYGVLSYNVSQRQRELGVRAALGARRLDLVGMVVRQGLGLTVLGLALGVAGAAALTRLMTKLLFGVTPLDAVAFGAAPLVLLLVAGAACLVPALRAAADPAEALRCE